MASSRENMSSSTFICRNEECCKVFTNSSKRLCHEKKCHIQKQHPNENETPQQDGNDDLIIDDFEMIPTQAIDLDPMMELRVENSVETQGDFEEIEEQIDQLAEDRNDYDIIDENTQETVEADSLNQNDLEDVIVELDNLYQKRQAQFQDTFLTKIFRKITADLKDNQNRNEALGFLVDVAGDNLNDKRFIQFLSENVGYKYKSQRLANILSSHKAQKNGNLDIFFPLKLIKRSVSFGYNRKMLL